MKKKEIPNKTEQKKFIFSYLRCYYVRRIESMLLSITSLPFLPHAFFQMELIYCDVLFLFTLFKELNLNKSNETKPNIAEFESVIRCSSNKMSSINTCQPFLGIWWNTLRHYLSKQQLRFIRSSSSQQFCYLSRRRISWK